MSNYLLYPWKKQGSLTPLEIVRAEGVYLWDKSGKKYIDMSSQLVNMNLGHGSRKIIDAIKEQAEKLSFISSQYALDVRQELARVLIEEIAPDNMAKVFFTLGGTDANEHALRIVKAYTKKHKILSSYRSYHGSTYGSANLSGEARRFPAEPGIPGFIKFFTPSPGSDGREHFSSETAMTAFYLQKLEEQIMREGADSIAALFMETIPGSNGVLIPPDRYIQGVREICSRNGILLVCDEVMSGFGRTGEWFSFMHYGIKPDIITFAKGITCGYVPLGGVMVSREIADYFDSNPFVCGMTYGAHPLGCAAGLAALKAYRDDNVFENVRDMEKVMIEELSQLKKRHSALVSFRVKGLFGMADLKAVNMEKIMKKLLSGGFATYSHDNMISVSPPLIINRDEIREGMAILDRVLGWIEQEYKLPQRF